VYFGIGHFPWIVAANGGLSRTFDEGGWFFCVGRHSSQHQLAYSILRHRKYGRANLRRTVTLGVALSGLSDRRTPVELPNLLRSDTPM
jgi:hypothetical protein